MQSRGSLAAELWGNPSVVVAPIRALKLVNPKPYRP